VERKEKKRGNLGFGMAATAKKETSA
jgi:hypothetical protein